ncbi:AAA family ATPase [Corynebacterium macclintockiae]|uniref:AAA family ATPase n=1 Tax=Corynebacterium macclintockiae TaxID=2913501 RepID=UPI003EC72CBB
MLLDKMHGPISHIAVNTATYNNCTIETSYLNFFYGRNGAGKSTIARVLNEGTGLTWSEGSNPEDYSVLVYDRAFVDANFSTYESLDGVFTVGQTNIEAEKQLSDLRTQRAEQDQEAKRQSGEVSALDAKRDELTSSFYEACWSLSQDVRAQFPDTQDGRRKKRTFAEAILNTKIAKTHDLAKVGKLYDVAFDKQATTYQLLQSVAVELPDDHLMTTAIVSTATTDFAKFIDSLQAADWVRHGHNTFPTKDGDPCPFCQQELPTGFSNQLAQCFDEAYEQSMAHLRTFAQEYKNAARQAWSIPLSATMLTVPPQLSVREYDTYIELLRSKLQTNVETIDRKLVNPSSQFDLEDVSTVLNDLNQLIADTNREIDAHNTVVANQKQQRATCTEQVWQHLAAQLEHTVTTYRTQSKTLANEIDTAKRAERTALDAVTTLDGQIKQLLGSVVDTSAVMDKINTVLTESGFQGFHLADVPDHANTYRVVRPDGNTAENLSEGERNFIAFLYFYFLVHGSLNQDGDERSKIVVIDDPVSSMDSSAMFIVAAHIRELVGICQNNAEYRHDTGQGDFVKQIFVLSHNPYFYKEVSYPNLNDYRYASYYLITKTDNISKASVCVRHKQDAPSELENYSPVLNTYTALWNEYKEVNSSITLLNVTRRILEHYFLQLCGYEGADLKATLLTDNRDKFIHTDAEGREDHAHYYLVQSMLTYISHHTSGIEDDTFLIAEDYDPKHLRHVFRRIFELMGQEQHYRMMTGVNA